MDVELIALAAPAAALGGAVLGALVTGMTNWRSNRRADRRATEQRAHEAAMAAGARYQDRLEAAYIMIWKLLQNQQHYLGVLRVDYAELCDSELSQDRAAELQHAQEARPDIDFEVADLAELYASSETLRLYHEANRGLAFAANAIDDWLREFADPTPVRKTCLGSYEPLVCGCSRQSRRSAAREIRFALSSDRTGYRSRSGRNLPTWQIGPACNCGAVLPT